VCPTASTAGHPAAGGAAPPHCQMPRGFPTAHLRFVRYRAFSRRDAIPRLIRSGCAAAAQGGGPLLTRVELGARLRPRFDYRTWTDYGDPDHPGSSRGTVVRVAGCCSPRFTWVVRLGLGGLRLSRSASKQSIRTINQLGSVTRRCLGRTRISRCEVRTACWSERGGTHENSVGFRFDACNFSSLGR
jgi:hypothetical protein